MSPTRAGSSEAPSRPPADAAPIKQPIAQPLAGRQPLEQPQRLGGKTAPGAARPGGEARLGGEARPGPSRTAASDASAARAFGSLLGARAGHGGKTGLGEAPVSDESNLAALVGADQAGAGAAAPAAVPEATVAIGVDRPAAAQIERMAAAVAEAFAKGRDPVYSITFNDPDAVAEGAVLIRDAGGALTVRLEGLSAAALSLPPRALEDQLRTALDRRRVRLTRVEWGAPAGAPSRTAFTKSQRFADRA